MRIALISIACALLLAACGSSGKPSTSALSGDPGLKFAQCMRSHGVSNFPDPSGGGAIQFSPSSGINPQAPAFQSAQQSCRKLFPDKGGHPSRMTAAERAAAVKFSECMRTHGEPDFPDPVEKAPSNATLVLSLRGMQFVIGPGLDPRSPAFRQAAERCGIRLPAGPQPRS